MRVELLDCTTQGFSHLFDIALYVDRATEDEDLLRAMIWKYNGEKHWVDIPPEDTDVVARATRLFNLSVELGVPYVDGEPDELFSDTLDEFGV